MLSRIVVLPPQYARNIRTDIGAIENTSFIFAKRAYGLVGLAVFCVVFGLMFYPVLAARAGRLISLGLAAYAHFARTQHYKKTKVWMLLRKEDRPPKTVAQRVIGELLRFTYIQFARQPAVVSLTFLNVLVVLQLTTNFYG